jgi:hypothetical protein
MVNMTPSTEPVTAGQIAKVNELLSAKMRKHEKELPSNIMQVVLGDHSLADELLDVIRKKVELQSNMIVRSVKVDRTFSAKEALDATGKNQYVADSMAKSMPNATDEQVEVYFFKLGRYISMNDLEKEYQLRGLVAVDPYTLAAINQSDPAFADDKPNCTQWKDVKSNWCYAYFYRGGDERYLRVGQGDDGWGGCWFFAGVRKAL